MGRRAAGRRRYLNEGLDLCSATPAPASAQVMTIEASKGQKAINSYFGH